MAERTVTIPVPIIATVTVEETGEFDRNQLDTYLLAAARELCTEAVTRIYMGEDLMRESEVLHRLRQIRGVREVDLHPSNVFELRPVPNLEPTVEIGSEPHQVSEGTLPVDVDYHGYRALQMQGSVDADEPVSRVMWKNIIYCGHQCRVVCDGRCDKAWGTCDRPKKVVRGTTNPDDDWFFLADSELGTAPVDPGTYEGRDGKPVNLTDAEDMNRWCVRACERSSTLELDEPIAYKDLSRRFYNCPPHYREETCPCPDCFGCSCSDPDCVNRTEQVCTCGATE
jgi:hypothetical protein